MRVHIYSLVCIKMKGDDNDGDEKGDKMVSWRYLEFSF